ncbi:MAG: glycyl-radical enzyme activating protein [Thermoplasmata archaeon]
MSACPARAIVMGPEGLCIDRTYCKACATWPCVEACPESALVRVGSDMTVEAVLGGVARDRDFYRNSGGGVTFSGGEPFAQAPFLLALLRGCRQLGISTAVETCGFVRWEDLAASEPLVDTFLFDLKVMDPERSKALTGRDNALILENLAVLAQRCPDRIIVRVPLIPGDTDDTPNLEAIAQFMLRHGLGHVHLEPYHTLGTEKFSGLGRAYGCEADPRALTRERVQEIGQLFEAHGIRWELP